MSLFKISVFYLIMLKTLVVVQSLVELPAAEDNNIAATEAIIRTTVNDLFSSLRLKDVTRKTRLKQLLTVHNFFVSLTLRDHDNLNEIVRLTRENHTDNTSIVTKPLNELLNEDNNDDVNDETVTVHVETFLNKLRELKDKYNVNNISGDTVVNKDVLKILEHNDFNLTNNEAGGASADYAPDDIGFWRESGRRIFRGTNTKIKYFPFMASVQFFKKFQCSGSIIKSDLIITAASCLQLAYNNRFFRENPAFLSVNVGSTFYEGGGENIPILEIYFHPTYNPKNLMNNLAIMRMIRRLNFKKSKRVQKIDFDRNETPLSITTDGITIIGWGAKGTSNILDDPWSNRLSFSVIDYYPLRECQEVYTKEYVTKTNFCAGFLSKGGGACNRDVGGPGIVDGLLTGVVSFGSPVCGAPDAPTVFTKLGYYTDWIEETMEQEVPEMKRRTTKKPPPTVPTSPPRHVALTTFKVEPVAGGRLKPRPAEPAALRIFEEPDFFTNFLATMFNSKEIQEYNDLMDSMKHKAERDNEKTPVPSSEDITEEVTTTTTKKAATTPEIYHEPATKLDVYDVSQERVTKKHKFTVAVSDEKSVDVSSESEEESTEGIENAEESAEGIENVEESAEGIENVEESAEGIENDVAEISDTTVVKKVIAEPTMIAPEVIEKLDTTENIDDAVEDIVKLFDNNDLMKLLDEHDGQGLDINNTTLESVNTLDDSVLTLLYLTDNENKTHDENFSGDGLSIPADTFDDVTFRENVTGDDYLEAMSKNDLLNLLSEAIDLEMKYDDNKDAVAS